MKREPIPESIGGAIAEQSTEARAVLGWLRELGPLDSKNLALAVRMPTGAVFGVCRRLQDAGLVAKAYGPWRLSGIASAWADAQDRINNLHAGPATDDL